MRRRSSPGTEGRGGEQFGDPDTALRSCCTARTSRPAAIGVVDRRRADSRVHGRRQQGRRGAVPDHAVSALRRAVARGRRGDRRLHPDAQADRVHAAAARARPCRCRSIVRTMPAPAAFRPIPPPSDRVAYGEYMINAAACGDCHTPMDDQGAAASRPRLRRRLRVQAARRRRRPQRQHHARRRHRHRHVDRSSSSSTSSRPSKARRSGRSPTPSSARTP